MHLVSIAGLVQPLFLQQSDILRMMLLLEVLPSIPLISVLVLLLLTVMLLRWPILLNMAVLAMFVTMILRKN